MPAENACALAVADSKAGAVRSRVVIATCTPSGIGFRLFRLGLVREYVGVGRRGRFQNFTKAFLVFQVRGQHLAHFLYAWRILFVLQSRPDEGALRFDTSEGYV